MLGNLSDLDLRHLRVFLAVVDAGGLAMAQHSLNVSTSTISTQLASLEGRLGFRLCERGRSGFRLTAKGERFTGLARSLLTAIDEFGVQARNMDRTLVGSLRIGTIGHLPFDHNLRLSRAIARFRQRDEAVRLHLVIRSSRILEEQVLSGELDAAIGYFWHQTPALHSQPLFRERQVACCGRDHPLFAGAGQISTETAHAHPWVWRTGFLPEDNTPPPPEITAYADNMEARAMLILSGHHLGYLPQHYAAAYQAQGLIAPLNPGTLWYDVTFSLITRQDACRNDITRAFLEDLAAVPLPDGNLSA
ncbi:LysR family transcriptional regulator [Novispirillum itersonii]|uniref:LysR family transcriptional regulator n=1 Tax=Novispirillum itersonii TaxID=189 RepID=UPI0003728305|nr:LysR family transcriptional regulator [Novispirillum itersonii]